MNNLLEALALLTEPSNPDARLVGYCCRWLPSRAMHVYCDNPSARASCLIRCARQKERSLWSHIEEDHGSTLVTELRVGHV